LLKRKYGQFVIYSILFFSVLIFAITLPLQYLGLFIDFRDDYLIAGRSFPSLQEYMSSQLMIAVTIKLMIIGIASSIKIAKYWLVSQKRQQNLMKEKLEVNLQLKEAELKYLKSQINPHFLFNALNNLYSLTLEKSDKAPEVVLKISSLLDYVLYECNVTKIDLEKEIENIKNYIDLQKMRYGNDTDIQFNIKGSIHDVKIAPLLILPLVENAFKHGLDKNVGKGYIYIDIIIFNDEQFELSVNNSLKGENNHDGEGIGLKNLKKKTRASISGKTRILSGY
jgi:two-component system LytT family sensor kinase